ncbi:MAG: winged helix DNA-binding domain-containing protein [Anaerolineae bacterium]|nr:winged helix DNA-binding domain-containing protein [Anaerolineae bacterium]NUQ06222.1 winged helix DNA-binding domain-containing protein [Anaerolineae bacterium]
MRTADIAALRLPSQRLAAPSFETAGAVVRWMGALQAQDYHQALWGLGARMRTPSLSDIEASIASGDLLRTWSQRGTIHFVPSEDAGWMVRLSAKRMIAGARLRRQQVGLDETALKQGQAIIEQALRDGMPMARPALKQRLEDGGFSVSEQRAYHLFWHCAHQGLICLGPNEGKQPTFVLFDAWVKAPRRLTRDEALNTLARRYFISHGPATVQDFAWWSGLTLTEARAGLEEARSALTAEPIDGKTFWWSADAVRAPKGAADTLLLAGFDEYLLGYTDRDIILNPELAPRVIPGGNGVFLPFLVAGGQVIATWKRAISRETVQITLSPFRPLNDSERAEVTAPAARYGAFHGLPAVVRFE